MVWIEGYKICLGTMKVRLNYDTSLVCISTQCAVIQVILLGTKTLVCFWKTNQIMEGFRLETTAKSAFLFIIHLMLHFTLCWFPIVMTNYHRLGGSSTNILSYSFKGQKSKMVLTGLKWKCWQGCGPSGGSGGESIPCLF